MEKKKKKSYHSSKVEILCKASEKNMYKLLSKEQLFILRSMPSLNRTKIRTLHAHYLTETEKITDGWKRYCEEMYSDNQPEIKINRKITKI